MAFALDGRHRRLAISHARLAFPDKSSTELSNIAKRMFVRLGEGVLEFLTYRGVSMEHCLSHGESEGLEIPHQVMKSGKGMLFLTAHYGNWELLGILGFAQMRQYEICAIGRDSGNEGVDRFVQGIREVAGIRILPKNRALRNVIGYLRRGQIACFLADQIAGSDGISVRFFDRPTWAVTTPARLSLQTGAPIVPVFIEKVRPGRHRVVYTEPLEPVRTGNLDEDILRMTQQGMQRLETFVRRRPDHWFWLHKRWKSKKAKKQFQDVYRIAVFSPHWIGDAVMSLPAQAALRKLFPDAMIACVVPDGLQGVYQGIGLYDRKISYGWTSEGFSAQARAQLIRQLRKDAYDIAILFPNSFDSAFIAWAAGIRHRVGYAAHGRRFLLTESLPQNASEPLHQSGKYQCLIEALGNVRAQGLPECLIAAEDLAWVRDALGNSSGRVRIALHAGATYGPTKRWFPERFVQLAKALANRSDVQVIFLGSEKEREALKPYLTAESFAHLDLMGKTNVRQLMAVLAQMDLLVANDSGPMHLAGLMKIPVIAIFGSTDPHATSPLGPHRIVRKPLPCSPCLKRSCANTAHLFECLDSVQVSDLIAAIDAVLPARSVS